jgi:DNA-directed RNA polymerase subunit RPC12/RpoP
MKWVQENVQTYFDVYKCSNCGAAIMVNESGLLPYRCEKCEQEAEE